MRLRPRIVPIAVLAAALQVGVLAAADSLRFGVIGDSGSGDPGQYRVGDELAKAHKHYPLDLVIMVGDNIYGRDSPADYASKFEKPYKTLLDAGVPFYASLGNHDQPNQRFYKPFNMNGKRFYSLKAPKESVRFFAIDSNYIDPEQLGWIKSEICGASEKWKIAFFHHPLYSSGRTHGSDLDLRRTLEPVFLDCGLDVVFAGHDHFYERIKPQKGILHFVSGGAGKLRRGDIRKTDLTDVGFDQGFHFMVVEIEGDSLHFTALSDQGKAIDDGTWRGRDGSTQARR
jgi:hypothetical protein